MQWSRIPSGGRRLIGVAILILGIQGCTSPAYYAAFLYQPEEMSQQILSGQVAVNSYQAADFTFDSGHNITPLCAMTSNASPVAIQTIDYLLANGVNINAPCSTAGHLAGYTALDIAIDEAYDEQETPGPYAPVRKSPSRYPVYMSSITKLLARGGTSLRGFNTIEKISAHIKEQNLYNDKFVAEWKEDIRREEAEARENSFFTAENLAVAAIAVSTVAANSAHNSAQASSQLLSAGTMATGRVGSGSAAVSANTSTANTSLQNMAGINAGTDSTRAARSQQMDAVVAKLAAEGGLRTAAYSYRCSAEEPLQTVTVPYKSEACRAAKENWFAVYACNNVERMSAANEQCRQGCGNIQCNEGQ